MRGPPTPISACVLKRLEVRDGASSSIYNSTPPTSVFTVTLEGERPIDAETGTLILLIHHGHQLLLSIRLTDLLKHPVEVADIVSIDRQLLRLSIKIPGRFYTVIADFEEQRDFGVTVCMLKKADFVVNEQVNSHVSSIATTLPLVTSLDANIASSIGTRLSSITPMSQLYSPTYTSAAQNEVTTSFTDMLNSPFPTPDATFSPIQATTTAQYFPPRMSSLPTYYDQSSAMMSAPAIGTQFNPYSIYLGRNTDYFNKPRVSSPLKHSLSFSEPLQTSLGLGSISSQGRTSAAELYSPVKVDKSRATEVANSFTPPCSTLRANDNENIAKSTSHRGSSDISPRLEPAAMLRSESLPLKPRNSSNFRDLMPQPRELPFASATKKEAQPKPLSQRGIASNAISTPKASLIVTIKVPEKAKPWKAAPAPKDSSPAKSFSSTKTLSTVKAPMTTESISSAKKPPKSKARPASKVNAQPTARPKAASSKKRQAPAAPAPEKATAIKKPRRLRTNAPAQPARTTSLALRTVKAQKTKSKAPHKSTAMAQVQNKGLAEIPDSRYSSSPSEPPSTPGSISEPLILVTDPNTLQELDQVTAKLFDQYEADVAGGSDAAASAKFYMDQIFEARKEFWYSKLSQWEVTGIQV